MVSVTFSSLFYGSVNASSMVLLSHDSKINTVPLVLTLRTFPCASMNVFLFRPGITYCAISRGLLGIIPSSAYWPLGSRIPLLPIRALPALSQTSESSGKLVWCGCHSCWPPPWEHLSFLLPSLTFPKVASDPHAMTCLLSFQWSLFSCLCCLPVKPGSLNPAGGHPTASC